jgi:AbrB family looped-hinge helix DNA binding protein
MMEKVATTKMSSKGQVVIPEEVRDRLHLSAGTQFIVLGEGDAIVLKTIAPPEMDEFKGMLKKVRTQARKAGMKQTDIEDTIKSVRKEGKKR